MFKPVAGFRRHRVMDVVAGLHNLPKHARYEGIYKRFDYYWGLGIEHETYLMTSQTRTVKTFEGAMKPERYSVNYYSAYKPEPLKAALKDVIDASGGSLVIPVMMNSHSWTHCDVYGEHKTTYERIPKPNPKFAGQTLFDWACTHSKWLRDNYEKAYVWDGDTVEFMTQRFYNTTVDSVIRELTTVETTFEQAIRTLPKQGVLIAYSPLRLAAPRNEPWASYLTNLRNVSMFNNGTIHINVTLPTRLGLNRRPLNWRSFVEKHRRLARLIQWLEPFWVALHGSGDPFAIRTWPRDSNEQFAAGSQRLAVSRYIGVGTFDTDTMPTGKILQVQRASLGSLPWYDWLHGRTAYQTLDVIGLDLNFNKHWAHGLELRFFDQFPMASIRRVLEELVYVMDAALQIPSVSKPQNDARWCRLAGEALYEGSALYVTPDQLNAVCCAFRIPSDQKEPLLVKDAMEWIMRRLRTQTGLCKRLMIDGLVQSSWCC